MRSLYYKNKTLRVADGTWERFKKKRKNSGLSWNLFIVLLLTLYKKYGNRKEKK